MSKRKIRAIRLSKHDAIAVRIAQLLRQADYTWMRKNILRSAVALTGDHDLLAKLMQEEPK